MTGLTATNARSKQSQIPTTGGQLPSASGKQSQLQGDHLFTIIKNQSKDRRKIEIQHNLQKKRDNSIVLRDSTADGEVLLATNSTLDQDVTVQEAPKAAKKF